MEATIIEEQELGSYMIHPDEFIDIPSMIEGKEVVVETTVRSVPEVDHSRVAADADEDTFECEKCGIVFSVKSTLELHYQSVHIDEAYYACEFCAATAIHWSEYNLHQCTNMENKPLTCPHCHQNVSTKKQLSIHEDIHALQRRFTSKKMDNYFARKLEEAEDPRAVDWGSKPFICGVCGKGFGKLYEVEYHEKLHNEERPPPNKCEKCGIRYINKNDLNKHVARGCTNCFSRKMIHTPTIF